MEPMNFLGRWLESGLADEEMALTGVGSCGAGMDCADKRGRASRVLSWSGVKHPGVDWTVEASLCSFGREVGGS